VKQLKARLRTWPVVAAVNAAIKAQAMERDVIRTRRVTRVKPAAATSPSLPQTAYGTRLRHRLGDRPQQAGVAEEMR